MSRDALRDTFFSECEDLLEAVATGLADLAAGQGSADTLHAVFRAVHSIKGAAGAFDLAALVAFAHRFETVLDAARDGRLALEGDALDAAARAGDVLATLVEAAREGREADQGEVEETVEALAALGADGDWEESGGFEPLSLDFAPMPLDFAPVALDDARPTGPALWRVAFAPRRAFHANGHDPVAYLLALSDLGPIEVACDVSGLPPLADLDPDDSHLRWTITLETDHPPRAIEEAFAFAEGLCDIEITALRPDHEPPGDPCDAVTPMPDRPAAPALTATAPQSPAPERPAAAPGPEAGEGARPTLRVDLDRVDRLVNAVGELIINQAAIAERLGAVPVPLSTDLLSDLDDYKLLARQIQESVMAIRSQPVRPLFQRMARVVREASRATGKPVRLVTEGEDAEVDRAVVESLADPLTHMVRNAVDHGLETPEARAAAGKPAQGTIRLSAEHQSGLVLIRVADDGGGLDRDRIRATAVRRGLIAADADLSPAEVDNLLFLPGFSTAAAVTNLSGRGVGLDVVKTAIASLGGRIGIESSPGRGSTFTLALPLTLAVLDGMLVRVAGEVMVIPLAGIQETVRPEPGRLRAIGRDGHVLAFGAATVPVVDLAARLGLRRGVFDPAEHLLLIVRSQGGAPLALAVEAITDQRQVVIKSLRDNWGRVPGISAATVLGDGRIALILDPDEVVADQVGRHPGLVA